MMLFQRRLLAELLRTMLGTLGLLTAVLVLIMSAQIVHRVEGLSLERFLVALPIMAAAQMQITVPLAVLVAVMLVYGRAAADNEVDTLRASGVHPWHLWVPGLVLGAAVTLGMSFVLDYAKPWSDVARRRLLSDQDVAALLRGKLAAGEPVQLDGGRTVLSVARFDQTGLGHELRLQTFGDDGTLEREILARTAELRVDQATGLFEVKLNDYYALRGPWVEGREAVVTRTLPVDHANLGPQHMTTPQLLAARRHGERMVGYTAHDLAVAAEMRLSGAMTPLLFVLLGVPVALLFRRHDRTLAFLVAFLIALFLYYPASEVSLALSRAKLLPLRMAAWSGSLLLLAVAGVLSWRVVRR